MKKVWENIRESSRENGTVNKNKYGGNYLNGSSLGKSFAKQDLNWKYNPKRILLSISILVSGRQEDMEKCVASLDKLRRRVPCELILTDTGCPKQLQGWLKQKADKVLKFTWCNDFAAARNVGLQAAVGEWFMFMDDDEWFEDTAEIEKFFLSGEYKRYQSASYIVRNYVNREGTVWRDTHLTRMTRRRPDSRFFYPIHESLWPLLDPEKVLEDFAHHYGYAYVDQEAAIAKRRRNLQILLPAIEEDPHCMKHYLQAVAEYYSMDEYESAYKIADKGIASCEPDREENVPHIDGLYAAAVRMRLRGGHSPEAARMGQDYLENAPISDLAKASICGDLAVAYGELGENQICRRYLWDYLKWKIFFTQDKAAWLKQETVVLDSCFENYQYKKVMGWGFAAMLSLRDAEGAEALLAKEPLEWWTDVVRRWYAQASEGSRIKWQADFESLIGQLDMPEGAADSRQGGKEESYAHVRQLYGILTMPETETGQELPGTQESGRAETESAQAGEALSMEGTGQNNDVTKEMEALAGMMKEKIRLLIGQGQHAAALEVIRQLQGYFPGDTELAQLREMCERITD